MAQVWAARELPLSNLPAATCQADVQEPVGEKANNCKHIPLVSEEEYAFANKTPMDLGGVREVKG